MTIPFEKLKARLLANPKVNTKTLLRYAEATGSRFHVRLSAA